MAYNLTERFPSPPPYYRFLDPGAYQNTNGPLIKPNKAPFLSSSQRNIKPGAKIWTHAIYLSDNKPKIPNCTAMLSKIPRFSYKDTSTDQVDELICECQDPNVCECEDKEKLSEEVLCQAKVRRRIFKGPPPRSAIGGGISAPSKRDDGFEILPNGSQRRIFRMPEKECPPFYDVNVNESTTFYRGCKWSQRTSEKKLCTDDTPGPAHYSIVHEPTFMEICADKVRAHKRKTSRQLRFIEMVQRRNILEALPGPSSYTPKLPKGADLTFSGPKADRFVTTQLNVCPGPTKYFIKREFDMPDLPKKLCRAKLPAPAPFGSKAVRLKPRTEEGPSPASYDPIHKPCNIIRCSKAPFLTSSERFKDHIIEDSDEDTIIEDCERVTDKDTKIHEKPVPTWQFKSNVVRMKPLKKLGPIPLEYKQGKVKSKFPKLQKLVPFMSSEERFRPWFNWIPVHAREKTPGPAYYSIDPPKCYPAVKWGPLCRTPRFNIPNILCPAPNKYKITIGVDNILSTNNQHLKQNLEKKHKFLWQPPRKTRQLNNDEKETVLLRESIALLNTLDVTNDAGSGYVHPAHIGHDNKKMLRCFAER